jgi:hypothetical protein
MIAKKYGGGQGDGAAKFRVGDVYNLNRGT